MKNDNDNNSRKIEDERRSKWLDLPENERDDQLTQIVEEQKLKDLVNSGINLLEKYIWQDNRDLIGRIPSQINPESKLQAKFKIRREHDLLARTLLIQLQVGYLTPNIFEIANNIKSFQPKETVGYYKYPVIFNQLTVLSSDHKLKKKELIYNEVTSSLETQPRFIAPLVKIVVDYISDNSLHGLDIDEPPSQFMPR